MNEPETIAKNQIAKTALLIKKGEMDPIEGIRKIYSLWPKSKLPLDDTYYSVSLLDDDTDALIKGDIQKNFSPDFIKDQQQWEENYLKAQKKLINEVLDELSKIPIIEEPEDPYAWPFDN